MPGFNKKRMTKRNQTLLAELQGIVSECQKLLQEAGLEVASASHIPQALKYILDGNVTAERMTAAPTAPPVQSPDFADVPIPDEEIFIQSGTGSSSAFGTPAGAITPAAPPPDPTMERRSLFSRVVPLSAHPSAPQLPGPAQPGPAQPGAPLSAEGFQAQMKNRLAGAEGKLQWDPTQGRYVGKSHGMPGAGSLPAGSRKPTKDLTPVGEQRAILGRVLGQRITAPPSSGIPNTL